MWDPYANFESTTLPNGLEVHVLCMPGRPWERVGFQIYSAANQDPPGLEGVAHFVEHMVGENAGIPKQDMLDFFSENGGNAMLGMTSYHRTQYEFFAPADSTNLATSFSLFGDMLLGATLVNNCERERGVIQQEFKRRFPNDLALEQFNLIRSAILPNTRMSHSRALGSLETINAISVKNLQAFYDLHYTPQNMAIVCVGGKTLDEIMRILSESSFTQAKPGIRTPHDQKIEEVMLPTSTKEIVSVGEYARGFTGSGLEVHALLPGSIHPEHVEVFKSLLDRQLHAEFREKRAWTYGIGTSISIWRFVTNVTVTSNVMVPEALEHASDLVTECVNHVIEDRDRFERQKQIAIAEIKMRDPGGSKICDVAQDMLWALGRIETAQDDIDTISEMDSSVLEKIAQHLMPERRFTMLVKP